MLAISLSLARRSSSALFWPSSMKSGCTSTLACRSRGRVSCRLGCQSGNMSPCCRVSVGCGIGMQSERLLQISFISFISMSIHLGPKTCVYTGQIGSLLTCSRSSPCPASMWRKMSRALAILAMSLAMARSWEKVQSMV